MNKLGQYVGKTVRSLKAEQAIELHKLKNAWLEAVGPFLGSQTEPVRIKNQILFLVVSSPMWAQEINLQQRLILQKLQGTLAKPLNKIICWVGEPHAKKSRSFSNTEHESDELVPWKSVTLPEERRLGIEKTLLTISDEHLKEKMRKLLELSIQREIYLINQGQMPCPLCGNFRPAEDEICRDCARERTVERERNVMRLLARRPWLTAEDLAEQTPIRSRTAFMEIRRKLLANLMLQAWQRTNGMEGLVLSKSMDEDLRTLLMDITMLRCSLPAHSLHPKHFYFALGKRLATGYLED